MTLDQFRKMALSFTGAEEREHMGHPDFRINGKIFATVQPDKGIGMVKLTPEHQHALLALDSASFTPAAGAWGRAGSTLVALKGADPEKVREALEFAWRNVRDSKPGKSRAPQRRKKSSRAAS